MPLRRRAIVLDLDGTLVDSAPDLARALNHLLLNEGQPTVDPIAVRNFVGGGARLLIERGYAAVGAPLDPAGVEARIPAFLEFYAAHIADESRPFAGAVEAIAALSAAGAVFGVCTNKSHRLATLLLQTLGIEHHFAAVLGGDSTPAKKPDPSHLTATLAAMGASPGEGIMVGDSAADVLAARGCGVPVIVASYGYGTAGAEAAGGGDLAIDSFADLVEAVVRLDEQIRAGAP